MEEGEKTVDKGAKMGEFQDRRKHFNLLNNNSFDDPLAEMLWKHHWTRVSDKTRRGVGDSLGVDREAVHGGVPVESDPVTVIVFPLPLESVAHELPEPLSEKYIPGGEPVKF